MTQSIHSAVGVVVIGRNEGERLRACLESVVPRTARVVYVDSGSTDGSIATAERLGVEVVRLEADTPFTAARGREAGLDRLLAIEPRLEFVQFVDGDCEVVDEWLPAALELLKSRPEVAIVCGRRRERYPERSFYNRIADLEWDTPAGVVQACGGDSLARAEALHAVGGFNSEIAAGEEPELCWRLRQAGWKIHRLPVEMTRHDIAMTRLGQWWVRSVRSGRGALEVFRRCGGTNPPFARQVRSARIWTIGWLAAVLVASLLGWFLDGLNGLALGFGLLALAPLLQVVRIAKGMRSRLGGLRPALGYGALMMIGKWGELTGQLNYLRDLASGRRTRLIEYKTAVDSI